MGKILAIIRKASNVTCIPGKREPNRSFMGYSRVSSMTNIKAFELAKNQIDTKMSV